MTVPKWLIPVLAIVASLAVAAAGILIGARFAPVETVEVPSGTAIAPVLAPVDPAAEAPDSGPGNDPAADETIAVSETVAQREVTLPGTSEGLDPTLARLLEALSDSAYPLFTLMEYDGEAESENPESGDDPCAPRAGEAPVDCPDGLQTTVLALEGIVDFRAGGQAFPPTLAEFLENGGNPYGSISCDDLEPAADEVPFGIVSTAPGTFSVRYWPSEHPEAELVVEGISSTPEDMATFEAAIAAGTPPLADIGLPVQCFNLPGIEPDTIYTAVVSGVDVLDRVSEPQTLLFNSSGAPIRPGARIVTAGENLVYVSAPHTYNQAAETRVLLIDDEQEPSCEIPETSSAVTSLQDIEVEIDEQTRVELNYIITYGFKREQAFAIPEGSTALVCVRWYAAGSEPSWLQDQPIYESSAIIQTPDRVLPTVRLDSVTPIAGGVESIRIAISTTEGREYWVPMIWRPDRDDELPIEVCGINVLEEGGVQREIDRLWDAGFAGDLVATITAELTNGAESVTRYVIPGRDGGCRGVCDTPPRERYVVALNEATLNQCGAMFGIDCAVPIGGAVGFVEFSVGYEQGASNGLSDWNVTPTVDASVDYQPTELPQLDLDARWRIEPPTGSATVARYPLRVDRPVDYTLRVFTAYNGMPAMSCLPGGEPLVESGSTTGSSDIVIGGLCAGEVYRTEIELTDAEGNSASWGFTDRDAWWGEGGRLQVPGVPVSISYNFHAQGYTRSYVAIARIAVGVNGIDITPRTGSCDEDGVIQEIGVVDAVLGAPQNDVQVTVEMHNSGNWTEDECFRNLDNEPATDLLVSVSYEELMSAEGVVIEAPGFDTRVWLHAFPRRE